MKIEPLPSSEQFHVEAAKGWVLLGDRAEAHKELDQIDRSWKQHPEVLELRWFLHAEENAWKAALPIARKIHKRHPDRLFGWLAHAHSLLKSTGDAEAAWKLLYLAIDLFDGPQVPYGLACYASLAGKFQEAKEWLARAEEQSDGEEATEGPQPDLEGLSDYLEKLEAE